MRPARTIPRAVAIASVTVAVCATVALAFAPCRAPMLHAVAWISRAAPAMTRDPVAPAASDSPLENAPAPGTFCPRRSRIDAAQSTQRAGASTTPSADSSALLLLDGSSSRVIDTSTAANCAPAAVPGAQSHQR